MNNEDDISDGFSIFLELDENISYFNLISNDNLLEDCLVKDLEVKVKKDSRITKCI